MPTAVAPPKRAVEPTPADEPGVPGGIACRATEHHAGSWWIVETGAFAALAVASVACLAARRGG